MAFLMMLLKIFACRNTSFHQTVLILFDEPLYLEICEMGFNCLVKRSN